MASNRDLRIRVKVDGTQEATAQIDQVADSVKKVDATGATAGRGGLAAVAKGLGAVATIAAMVKLHNVSQELAGLDRQLVAFTGSSDRAAAAMDMLRRLPGELSQNVSAYTTALSRGINASEERMRAWITYSRAFGKDLDQVVGAVAQAATGQFRALEQFGIRVRESGDKLKVSFQGQTAEIARDSGGLQAHLAELANANAELGRIADENAGVVREAWRDMTTAARDLAVNIGLMDGTQSILQSVKGVLAEIIQYGTGAINTLNDLIARAPQDAGAYQMDIDQLQTQLAPVFAAHGTDPLAWPEDIWAKYIPDVERLNALLADQADYLASGGDAARDLAQATGDSAAQFETQGRAVRQARDEVAEYLERMQQQVATYGMTRRELIEYEGAQMAAAAATDAQRQAVEAMVRALLDKIAAQDEATAAKQRMMDVDRNMAAVTREMAREVEREAEATRRLLDALDPLSALTRDYEQNIKRLQQALAAGLIDEAEFERMAALLQKIFGEDWLHISYQAADEWTQLWLEATGDIATAIERILVDGLDSAGDAMRDLARQIHRNIAREFARQITVQIQQVVTGGQVDRMGMAQGAGGMAGSMIGSSVGGGGPWASTGATLGAAGGMAAGAAWGASAGTAIMPVIGTVIGAVLGGILGGLFGGLFDSKPRVRISGPEGGEAANRPGFVGQSPFGEFAIDWVRKVDADAVRQIGTAMMEMERLLAALMSPEQVDAVSQALRGFEQVYRGKDIDPEKMLSDRLDVIIAAAEPGWARYLRQFTDVEERIRQFTGMTIIRDFVANFDDLMASLDPDPLVQIRRQLDAFTAGVDSSAERLQHLIDTGATPAEVSDAAALATQAIIDRYLAEIAMVRDLQAAIEQAAQQLRQFRLDIEQRLADVTGDSTGLVALAGSQRDDLRGQIMAETDPERALALLGEFVGAVDTWLAASRAAVTERRDALLAEQQAIIETAQLRLQALAAERAEILGVAAERMREAQQASQAASQSAAAARQAAADALREQLALAQQWLGVLDRARAMLDELRFGSANPLDGFGRAALMDDEIARLRTQMQTASPAERAGIAAQLLELLRERLALGGELHQRPSDEYTQLYNETMREIAGIADAAEPHANRAEQLQEQIAMLQGATVTAIGHQTDVMSYLSEAERRRLDEIADEEAEQLRLIQEAEDEYRRIHLEAEAELVRLNMEAAEHYRWAREEGERLHEERNARLEAALHEITGGLDPEAFIAQRLAESQMLLTQIRDLLDGYLGTLVDQWAHLPPAPGGTGGPGGPRPGDDDRPPQNPHSVAPPAIQITVNGAQDPALVAAEVRRELAAGLRDYAPALKRELAAA